MNETKEKPNVSERLDRQDKQLLDLTSAVTELTAAVARMAGGDRLSPNSLWEEETLARRKREQEFEQAKVWLSKSCPERTQIEADKLFAAGPGTKRYRVQLVAPEKAPKIDQPSIEISAHSEDEAKAFYQRLCGITSFTAPNHMAVVPA